MPLIVKFHDGEVARAIAEKAQINLTVDELKRLTSASQDNPESYDAYLKGLLHHNKVTPEGLKLALQYANLKHLLLSRIKFD